MDFETISSALQSLTESEVVVELAEDFADAKPFVTLDDREKTKFRSKYPLSRQEKTIGGVS
jgi:hypothetical protein